MQGIDRGQAPNNRHNSSLQPSLYPSCERKILNPRIVKGASFFLQNPQNFRKCVMFFTFQKQFQKQTRFSDTQCCSDEYLATRRTEIPATPAVHGHTPCAASHQLLISISAHFLPGRSQPCFRPVGGLRTSPQTHEQTNPSPPRRCRQRRKIQG